MNFYLFSNSFKSFFLFRREILFELSKKYNLILVANKDGYYDYFDKKYKCIALNNYFNNKNFFKNIFLIAKIIFIFLKKKPHIVQTYTIHPNLICIPLAKLFLSKTIAMITGMGATSVGKAEIRKLFDVFYKISFLFCDHIIFVNCDNEKYFKKKLAIKVNSTRIYGAGVVIKKKLKFKSNYFYLKHNLRYAFNILFVGRLIKEKGILDAIKVFKLLKIPNKKLIFVGDFDKTSFSEKLNIKIFRYPGIICTGQQLDTTLFYEFANIVLLPSITEGMPTTLMEAIVYNVPTVSYKIPGVRDLIKNNLTGITVDVKDINNTVNQINKIYRSRKFVNLIKKNSSKIKFKINREKVVKKVLSIYEQI